MKGKGREAKRAVQGSEAMMAAGTIVPTHWVMTGANAAQAADKVGATLVKEFFHKSKCDHGYATIPGEGRPANKIVAAAQYSTTPGEGV